MVSRSIGRPRLFKEDTKSSIVDQIVDGALGQNLDRGCRVKGKVSLPLLCSYPEDLS